VTRSATAPARPRFSVVSAVYEVEPYLPAFIRSVERLRARADEVEIVAVDDGSTDGSLDLLRAWSGDSRFRVRVVTQPNGGQASARNLGLDHATGEWVTFPDPDDILDRDYLRSAARFAAARPSVEAMSARPVLLDEATGTRSFGHPRRWQYLDGNRIADLVEEPNVFFGLASGSFFRLDRIAAAGLRFDPRVRPNFEDAHFAVRYLLDLPSPRIGLVGDSTYIYRKRAAGTSTLQRSMADPARYSTVLELGYLDVVERSRTSGGAAPEWIQQLLTYELSWYLSEDDKVTTSVRIPPDMQPRFDELFDRVLRELDPAVVERHAVRPLKPAWRDILARAGRGRRWHSPAIVATGHDAAMRLRRLQYRFTGEPPAERLRVGDAGVAPAFAKTMAHRYLGRDLLFERILWLPDADELEVELDGRPVTIVPADDDRRPRAASGASFPLRRPGQVARLAHRAVRRVARGLEGPTVRAMARLGPIRRRYANAWVVMDRIHDADDNGERLFEHLRAKRPDINAWFVLERASADWARLASTQAGRLVAHGSLAWKLLLLNAAWLASSHADLAVVRPPQITRIAPYPGWKVAFLQHGVIKDDLSRWLNDRELDLFVTSTQAEWRSVAGDGTPYAFGEKEVVETGLPRFDRLIQIGRQTPRSARDLVLVAPTWRSWLSRPLPAGSQRRDVDDPFWDSTYLRTWLTLLHSEAIGAAVRDRGWRLGFMPHPNLQRILPALELPAGVEALAFEGTDVQRLYARCALLVTDYSSVVFNTAYLDRPAVYFQFDRDEVLGGGHVGRRGYFDYERDGFGPVADDLEAAEAAIVATIRDGARPAPEYQARIDATFPSRDGGACARVVEAMERRGRPWASSA
jgi:glycosyltransferase involved in cell wall biosynthesis/CDP-glycerol glycerophosphotransferase (TagB/SpsB family)